MIWSEVIHHITGGPMKENNPYKALTYLQWILPLSMVLLVVGYQLLLARWVHNNYNENAHFGVEILFFGTTGPLLAYWTIYRIGIWLEEKQAVEKQARYTEKHLAAVTSISADAIITLNEDGRITTWNRGAKLIFGYPGTDIIGRPFEFLLELSQSSQRDVQALLSRAHQEKIVREFEIRCLKSSGEPIDVELTATLLDHHEQASPEISIILRDITKRKLRQKRIHDLNVDLNKHVAERTAELAEKVEELALANDQLQKLDQVRSEFISLISHQIRSPLANIQGAIEQFNSKQEKMYLRQEQPSNIIQEQVSRIDSLVEDVLLTSKIESGNLNMILEPVSLKPVIETLAAPYQSRQQPRDIHLKLSEEEILVFSDRGSLVEIISNLIDNADKYTPREAPIEINVVEGREEATITVRDYGEGIPESDLLRVFDKFFRVNSSDNQKAYGYGLGLYACKLLVEAQGGSIIAANHPDGGAVFSFTVALWREQDGKIEHSDN